MKRRISHRARVPSIIPGQVISRVLPKRVNELAGVGLEGESESWWSGGLAAVEGEAVGVGAGGEDVAGVGVVAVGGGLDEEVCG